jgi:hypothetical protein
VALEARPTCWRGALGIGGAASEGGRARCGNGGDVGYSEVHGREGERKWREAKGLRAAWRPGVCVLATASTRVGHAARASCARSATIEAKFKILNSECSETKLERSD